MDIEWLRRYCLSLPHTTENVAWEEHLLFKVGGKMYAITSFEPDQRWLAFKCTEDDFARLVEQPGIIPSPYLARAKWVSVETDRVLAPSEVKALLRQSYELVLAKLPRKTREALGKSASRPRVRRKTSSGNTGRSKRPYVNPAQGIG